MAETDCGGLKPTIHLLLLLLVIGVCGIAQQPSAQSGSTTAGTSGQTAGFNAEEEREIALHRTELGDQDPTYLRMRTAMKYDHKFVPGDVSKDRFRSYTLLSFGKNRRLAFAAELPFLVQVATPQQQTTGIGDAEFKLGGLVTHRERFRQAIGTQLNTQTSSDSVIGGSATVLKALYYNSIVLSDRWIIDGSMNYAHSIHLANGASTVSEIEPEVTISRKLPWLTMFLHFDNYYDFPVSEWGNTAKLGVSRAVGREHQWTISVYDEYGLNAYARAKFTHDIGITVVRYFGPK